MVFVAENVAEHGVLDASFVADKTHCDACHGLLHLDACIEQGECAGAYGGHRRGAVALEDVADDAAYIGEVVGEHALECAVCEVAVADFAASYSALGLGLTGGEWREVVVEQEAFAALAQHFVDDFLVEFRSEGHCGESLCLAAGEHCRAVGAGQIVGFAPDGAYLVGLAAVEAHAFVEHATAHGFLFYIVVVAAHECLLGFTLVFRHGVKVFLAYGGEAVHAPMLVGTSGLGDGVGFVVAFCVHVGAEFVVVHFVAVFAFYYAYFAGQFLLHAAHVLDGFVGAFEE